MKNLTWLLTTLVIVLVVIQANIPHQTVIVDPTDVLDHNREMLIKTTYYLDSDGTYSTVNHMSLESTNKESDNAK